MTTEHSKGGLLHWEIWDKEVVFCARNKCFWKSLFVWSYRTKIVGGGRKIKHTSHCKKQVLRCEKRFFTVRTNIQSGEKLIFPPGKLFCSREKKIRAARKKVFRGVKWFFTARIKISSGEKLIFPPGEQFCSRGKKKSRCKKKNLHFRNLLFDC